MLDITSYLLGKKNGGGGGGTPKEYEEGTVTLTEDTASPTINFANNHTTTPIYVAFIDTAEQPAGVSTVYAWFYVDIEKTTGYHTEGQTTGGNISKNFGYVAVTGQRTETSNSTATNSLAYSSSNTGESTKSYPRYFVKENQFKPVCNVTSALSAGTYLANHTYKWIAIWK